MALETLEIERWMEQELVACKECFLAGRALQGGMDESVAAAARTV